MKIVSSHLLLILFVAIISCQQKSNSISSGKSLAKAYCASCHQYPEPDLLDKSTWEQYVLPRMGYMLGHYPNDSVRESLLGTGKGRGYIIRAGVYPEKPVLSQEEWKKIQAFFKAEAPEQLTQLPPQPLRRPLPHFALKQSPLKLSPPSTTMAQIAGPGKLYIGDANTQAFYLLNENLKLIKAAKVSEGAVDYHETEEVLQITVMGSFSPTDDPSGFLLSLPVIPGEPSKPISRLQRPVHTAYADLNQDNLEDIIICEFGKWTGCLAWWENQGKGFYRKHILRNKPGAINVYARDWNDDGLVDLLALFGQGDEGVFYYENQGNGQFKEQKLLAFPPSYGSSYLGLFDWDQDGKMDLIYTCGDNADYPPVMKPYHGIRIYLNKGSMQFTEHLFYPYHGAYRAIPADYDLDGDWDIAAISFFPDFDKQPEAAFIYLENDGTDTFTPYTFEEENPGRWLVMDTGDLDDDGDTDLILGSLTLEVLGNETFVKSWVEQGIPFVLLENTIR